MEWDSRLAPPPTLSERIARVKGEPAELTANEIDALTRLAAIGRLHTAIVEFGIGDSAARELGVEAIHQDNVRLEEANALGSYVTGSAVEEFKNQWDDRTVLPPDKKTGKHRVLLDLDVPHVYVPSSTDGHGHLIIDVPQDFKTLQKLLQLLGDMHILQYGFVDATTARGETWLRTPGTKKTPATEGM